MNKRFKVSMRTRYLFEGYGFVIPWLLGFLLFMAFPLGLSLYYSFQDLRLTSGGMATTFIGMRNFREAFTIDIEFTPKLLSTFFTMISDVPLILIFSMFIAILLNRRMVGRTFFRAIFFLPVIIATGAVLQKLIDQGATHLPIFAQNDLMLQILQYIPVEIVLPLIKMLDTLTLVMWDSGVQILIFLAGLQTVSPSLYEAAKIDGATSWELFWKITFPLLIPMILVNTLFSIVNSFTKVDNSLMTYIHDTAFRKSNFSYASALGWIYFVVIFIVIGIVLYVFRDSNGPRREAK